MTKFKVGDTVKVINKGHREDCSYHKLHDTFIIEEIHCNKWLRSKEGEATGIPYSCCELVTTEIPITNLYPIY